VRFDTDGAAGRWDHVAVSTYRQEEHMRTVLAAILAVACVAGTGSLAIAADEKKPNPQQERMKACSAQAGDKKGDERKAFMSQCLKGEGAAPMTQQEKMKKCNAHATAKALKGDDRKAFMSDCLKADKKS
jgi:psiF repeat